MIDKPNILVVCGRNKKRSRTAEYIFKNDSRFNIRSVGLSSKSERRINENVIQWADLIFVMEQGQFEVIESFVLLNPPNREARNVICNPMITVHRQNEN